MSARSLADWARLGSEAECEDSPTTKTGLWAGSEIDREALAYHFDADLTDPEITPDREAALAALERGYREGA